MVDRDVTMIADSNFLPKVHVYNSLPSVLGMDGLSL